MSRSASVWLCFFFQAEDGIRDSSVTGVQTCALPILEAFDSVRADASGWRAVAVGGGAAGSLWPQLVSDVSGRAQDIPEQAIGASYGDALLAATAGGMVPPDTDWTTRPRTVQPPPDLAELYDRRYGLYRDLFAATRPLNDRL